MVLLLTNNQSSNLVNKTLNYSIDTHLHLSAAPYFRLLINESANLYAEFAHKSIELDNPSLLFIDKQQEVQIFSTQKETQTFIIIQFYFDEQLLAHITGQSFSIDQEITSIITFLKNEQFKIDYLKHSKPAISYDQEINSFFILCQQMSIHLLSLLVTYCLQKIQLSSLPRHYQQELALLTIPSNEKVILKKKHILYSDELVDPIIRYLEEHLSENFFLEQLAQIFFISPASLKKHFRKVNGKSVISYFKELKMEKAKRLVLENELTYTEIADILGFHSIHHFSSAFKKYTGLSPSKYYL
ncbi:AraC family transcriptional regulator, partial [Enterococcus faecium]|uniref:helix-turn-helix transcriptional regulator n=1 Tax=Enterococcus faecium TaxID=1352 RepID=UPI0030C7C35B